MADDDSRPGLAPAPTPTRASKQARARYLVLSVQRLLGGGLIMLGLLALNGALGWGKMAGAVLVIVGLVDFAVLPIVLARRWRTPRQGSKAE